MDVSRQSTVTIIPRDRTVVVYLERTSTPPAWEPLLDQIRRYAENAAVVELHGPGWSHPFAHAMELALRQTLAPHGVVVISAVEHV